LEQEEKVKNKPVKRKRKKKRKSGGHYHTGTHVSPKAGECKYRSGWELLFMQHLDADPNVRFYLYEGVIVTYVSNVRSKRLRKYWPDFLVQYEDGSNVLIEVKPLKRVTQDRVQKKLAAATVWCAEHNASLRVVTEVDLKALGLL
jgi:hypothetical protein